MANLINKSVGRGTAIPTYSNAVVIERGASMIIYLYVKTHRKTGIKYLGKTSKNPFKYLGSGINWLIHIKEYGKDISTEILKECSSNEELSKWGRYYSDLWKVAESDEWANKIPETGGSAQGRKRPQAAVEITAQKNKGKKRTEEFRKNRSGIHNSFYGKNHSASTKEKMKRNHTDVSGSNNPMYGKKGKNHPSYGKTWKWSEDSRKNICGKNNPMYGKESPNRGKTPEKINCPHCHLNVSKGNFTRWHGAKCKFK